MGVHLWSGRLYVFSENKKKRRSSGRGKKRGKRFSSKKELCSVLELDYVKCPRCKKIVSYSRLKLHLKNTCPAEKATNSAKASRKNCKLLKKNEKRIKKNVMANSVANKERQSICPSCRHYNGKSCSVSPSVNRIVLSCLFYKPV